MSWQSLRIHSLFWRIFLAFWVAMSLIVVGVMLVTMWKVAEEHRVATRTPPDLLIDEAATVLRKGGRPALTTWMRQQTAQGVGNLLVFDSTHRELLGRDPPWRAPPPPLDGRTGAPTTATMLRQQMMVRELDGGPRFTVAEPPAGERVAQIQDGAGNSFWILFGPELHEGVPLRALALLFRRMPLEVLLVAVAVSAAMSLVLARYLSRPIEKLRAAARAVSHGNLAVRVAPSLRLRKDELGSLAADFDTMAQHLRSLLESRQQLMRDLSHELRSPLARLQVALGLAQRQGANMHQELGRIEREAQRLDALIGQILRLARLQDSATALAAEPFDVPRLLEELSHDANLEARARHVRVRLTIEGTRSCRICADRGLLGSAIENVLRNAIRFTLAGSTVDLVMRAFHREVRVLIQDRGPGVPEHALARIFEPFVRLRYGDEHDADDHGLGLAITQRIVRLHGGTVCARNRDGGGLEVELVLPLNLPADEQSPDVHAPAIAPLPVGP